MNRKILILSLLSFALLFTASLSFAAFPGEKTSKVKAAVSFTPHVTVTHRHVARISPFQDEANFVVCGHYGDSSVTHMEIEYYINNDSSTIATLPLKEISTPFESAELTVPSAVTSFSYRFVSVVDNNHLDKKYYPYNSNTWIHVPVADYSTKTIGVSGGSIILDNGDQRYGYSEMLIRPDSLSGDRLIQMKECDINSFGASTADLVRLYDISTQQTLSKAAQITLYYGSSNEGKYVVKYWDGISWKKINSSQVQDTLNKTITFESASFGQYGIFIKGEDDDSGYRPEYRVLKFGGKTAFRNLQAGDTVTIYDINGRQVKKLASPPFEWDGRKDNGSYAESGSYIYQIKVGGKIISGSIAFVK